MNPKIIYPIPNRQNHLYRYIRNTCSIVFTIISIICLIVNYFSKGKMWSIIVIWSLFITWNTFFSLRLVEFSFFSHIIKLFISIVILLGLIDYFIAPGFAQIVIPIVVFAFLLIMMIVYFVTYDKKERHLTSIFVLGLLAIISIPLYTNLKHINWLAAAFEIASIILFVILLIVNRKEIIETIKIKFRKH